MRTRNTAKYSTLWAKHGRKIVQWLPRHLAAQLKTKSVFVVPYSDLILYHASKLLINGEKLKWDCFSCFLSICLPWFHFKPGSWGTLQLFFTVEAFYGCFLKARVSKGGKFPLCCSLSCERRATDNTRFRVPFLYLQCYQMINVESFYTATFSSGKYLHSH